MGLSTGAMVALSGGPTAFLMLVVILAGGVVLGLVQSRAATRHGRRSERELAAMLDHYGVPATARAAELMARYVDRARRCRFGWTFFAAVVSFTVSIAWYRRLDVGFSTYPPLTDIPLMLMLGWLCGVVRTELFRLRRGVPARTAVLAPRGTEMSRSGGLYVACRVVTGVAVAAAVANEVLPGDAIHPFTVFVIAGLSVAALAAAEACRRTIVYRSRPALPEDLAVADSAVRRIGLRGLGLGATGVALCCLSYELSLMGLRPGANGTLAVVLDVTGPILLLAALFLAEAARTLVHVPVPRRWRFRRRATSAPSASSVA